MQKSNITDIAKMTGLSISTVSRVLSGKAKQYRIGIKSQQKVEEAAKKLQYIPNHFAANLRSGKSGTLALIIPSLNNPFFARIASEISNELRKLDYIVIISDSNENVEIEKKEIQQLIARNIEGLIIVPCGDQWIHIKEIENKGIPVVCIDRYFENLDIPYVATDNFEGAFSTTNYLIENGHTHISCIQGTQSSSPNRLRVEGFSEAMKKSKLKNFEIRGSSFTFENGYIETKLILQKEKKPTAIFTLSNTIAMGCIKAIREENLKIPQDISLITFDDHPYQEYLFTPLSCIAQPLNKISKMAVQLIFSKIQNQQIEINQILFKPKMILRNSVGKI